MNRSFEGQPPKKDTASNPIDSKHSEEEKDLDWFVSPSETFKNFNWEIKSVKEPKKIKRESEQKTIPDLEIEKPVSTDEEEPTSKATKLYKEIDQFLAQIKINPDELLKTTLDKKGNIISPKEVLDSLIKEKLKNKFNLDDKSTEIHMDYLYWGWLEMDYQQALIDKLKDNSNKTDLEKLIIIELINSLAYGGSGGEHEAWTNTLSVAKELEERLLKKETTILEKSLLKKIIYDLYELDDANRNWDYVSPEYEIGMSKLEKNIGPYEGVYEYNIDDLNKVKFDFTEEQKYQIAENKGPFSYFSFHPEELVKPTYLKFNKETKKYFHEGDYINCWLAPGIVGIYGINGRLVGCKKLEDIKNKKGVNTIDDVFDIRSSNNTDKKDLALFKISSSLFFRDYIKKTMNVDMSTLSIANQFYFLDFIQNKTEDEVREVVNFVKSSNDETEKNNKIKTFLSIEHGGKQMGDKILELGNKLPPGLVGKVFAKYGQIVDNVEHVLEFTQKNFSTEVNTTPELIEKIKETLFIKGKQVLLHMHDSINNDKQIEIGDVEQQLDRINADTITTLAIFKQALKNGAKIPLESIHGAVFAKKEATDITLDQKKEMNELYDINWMNHPDREFVNSLKDYFNTAFSSEENKHNNYFYTFEKDEKIRAFVRFEKQTDNSLYASALNVDDATKNFGLGEAMMDEALTREAKQHILHASCRKDNPSNMRYFEKGFIAR